MVIRHRIQSGIWSLIILLPVVDTAARLAAGVVAEAGTSHPPIVYVHAYAHQEEEAEGQGHYLAHLDAGGHGETIEDGTDD